MDGLWIILSNKIKRLPSLIIHFRSDIWALSFADLGVMTCNVNLNKYQWSKCIWQVDRDWIKIFSVCLYISLDTLFLACITSQLQPTFFHLVKKTPPHSELVSVFLQGRLKPEWWWSILVGTVSNTLLAFTLLFLPSCYYLISLPLCISRSN